MILDHYENYRLKLIADLSGKERILDIGYAAKPNMYLPAAETTGLDLEKPRLSTYKEEVQADVRELPRIFAGRVFDTIICAEFIEHLEDPYAFLREIKRFLSPQGQLIISTPNPISFPVVAFEWLGTRKFFYSSDHTYYFLPRWVWRLLERTGYKVVKQKGVGLWLPGKFILPCPVSLSYQAIYVAEHA